MDLFAEEQSIYDHAADHIKAVEAGEPFDFEEFKTLTKEYYAILKLLRRMTKFSDRTTDGLHESNLELIDQAHYDSLTGIYNRRFLEEELEKNIGSLTRSGDILSLLMIDIDFFKRYNDTYGHGTGDKCLKSVAKAIAGCILRAEEFVARYGGEEFVVVLPNMDQAGAAIMGENILNAVRRLSILHEKNEAADF